MLLVFLARFPLDEKSKEERSSDCRRSVNTVCWEGHLCKRGQKGLLAVVLQLEREMVVSSLHNNLGYGDSKASQMLVPDRIL